MEIPLEPFFFARAPKAGDARQLYGMLFRPPPAVPERDLGIVLCGGFAGEFEVFRSHQGHIARLLAAKGHPVLRFDYLGYGDSDGEFEDASVDSMQHDVERAMEVLVERTGVARVGLMGLRLGGTVAALAAGQRAVDTLVLWEPVLKPWDDLYAELRQTLSMQTVLFRDVKLTRDKLVDNVLAGKPSILDGYDLNIIDDGFPLAAELVRSAKKIDLVERPPAIGARTLVVHVRKREGAPPKPITTFVERLAGAGARCELAVAIEPSLPWRHEDVYMTHSPRMFEKTLAWLDAKRSEAP